MQIDHRIFRAYDIRGKAHEQLTDELCRLIGHAFGSALRERTKKEHLTVCVGRDARLSGPEFETAAIDGLLEAGCSVIRIGAVPTPVNSFVVCHEKMDGGMQITASHNPAPDNGIKLCTADGHAFAGSDIQDLRRRIEERRFKYGDGTLASFDGAEAYIEHVVSMFGNIAQGMKIVVDSGNGIAGPVNVTALQAMGAEVIELYTDPDGTFPNHQPDPSKIETLTTLRSTVQTEKARIGLAFDGDGDRLGIVDEEGRVRSADEILLLLAVDHLSRFPGAPVVFTVSNSGILQTEIEKLGGKPILCKVGHSFVEHAMHEAHAALGGEQSGHFFCAENYYGFDDALMAALRVLEIVAKSGRPVSSLFADFPTVYQSQEKRPYVHDDHKAQVIKRVEEHFGKHHAIETMDGVRIDFGDGAWAGIRQSNTSPCISICMEARSPEKLQEIEEMILGHLGEYVEIKWDEK